MTRRAVASGLCLLWIAAATACPRRGGPPVADSASLRYRFVLEREPALAVRVEVTTAGSDSGVTEFTVEREWGGVDAGGDDLSDARAAGANGRALIVERPAPERWRVRHAAGEPITLSYRLVANTHRLDPSPAVNRRPLLDATLFHAYGHLLLAVPPSWDSDRRRRVDVVWEGFDAAGWKAASSFGIGTASRQLDLTRIELTESVWIAGDLAILERDVAGRPLWTAIAGHEWQFRPEEVADLAARVVRTEREFFADFDHPYFLITLVPVGEAGTGSRSLGGTGLTHSFAMQFLPDTPLGGDFGGGMHVPALLAHEMFHFWAGHTVRPAQPEQLCYWFTEGFTDFYTRRLLYREGLISLDEYARNASAKLAELWTNAARDAPNERILADFWRDEAVKRLPYVRGDAVAMMVDRGIRDASNGKRSLDDFMRELVREGRTGARVTPETLLAKVESWAGATVAARVRRTVLEGALPELDADTFAPCLTLEPAEITPYTLGFEFAASRSAGAVVGVVPGSAAAAAGLRDGQKLQGWSVSWGDVTKPVVLKVQDDAGRRDITYLPRGAPMMAPQLRVSTDLKVRCPEP